MEEIFVIHKSRRKRERRVCLAFFFTKEDTFMIDTSISIHQY